MLNRNLFLRCCWLVLALALVGCGAPDLEAPAATGADDPVIATYAGGEVRRSDIAASLATRLARLGATPDVEARRATVQALAARQARIGVLHQQAIAAGMPQRPDVAARVAARKDLALAQVWLEREDSTTATVSEQVIEAELARRLPGAARQETRAFSHIFLRAANPEALTKARQTAAEIERRLKAGEAFAALAREYSDSISARAGGSVNLTTRAALGEDLGTLIFDLTEGAVSEPIVNHDGLHLFRVDAIVAEVPADASALRESIATELKREARATSERNVRQLAVDEAGVDIANALKSLSAGCANAGDSLFVVSGQALTCSGFEVLRMRWPEVQSITEESALTWLISNRVLAQRLLDLPGSSADVEIAGVVEQAERNELVAARRDELLDVIDMSASPEELAARHQELGLNAPELHEFVVDLLFFVQSGSDANEVNTRGERIVAQLREGADFSNLLDAAKDQPSALVLRAQSGLLLAELSRDQPPLRDELLRLAAGEVSVPLYISGNPIRASGKVLIADSGLLFVRKVEERVLALDAARDFLIKSVADQKRAVGLSAVQAELDRLAAMQLLLADG